MRYHKCIFVFEGSLCSLPGNAINAKAEGLNEPERNFQAQQAPKKCNIPRDALHLFCS